MKESLAQSLVDQFKILKDNSGITGYVSILLVFFWGGGCIAVEARTANKEKQPETMVL